MMDLKGCADPIIRLENYVISIKVLSHLVPERVEHHRVETDYDYQRKEVTQNEEAALKSFCP